MKTLACKIALICFLAGGAAASAEEDQFAPKPPLEPGCKIIEGDIVVPEDYDVQTGGRGTSGCFQRDFWDDGVPYEFDSNVTAANQAEAVAAMSEWEAVANVRFRPWVDEYTHVHFQNSTENNSDLGRGIGKRTINIFNWTRWIIVHEIGHVLGMYHEQGRPDRDTFITIHDGNIGGGEEHNFDKQSSAYDYGPYDFDSIMHYGQCAFSNCTCPASCVVIEVNAPWHDQWQGAIGQRNHFSQIDILTAQMMYPNSGDVFVDRDTSHITETGSFFYPYDTFGEGASNCAVGGRVIIQPGTYTGCAGTYTKRMTLRAPLDGVILR